MTKQELLDNEQPIDCPYCGHSVYTADIEERLELLSSLNQLDEGILHWCEKCPGAFHITSDLTTKGFCKCRQCYDDGGWMDDEADSKGEHTEIWHQCDCQKKEGD